MKKVIVSVTNDLVSDQRVHKVCTTLTNMGFDVLLIGRKLPYSPKLEKRIYQTKRMRLIFKKGPLFYAEYNKRLLLLLVFRKFDLLVSNDLDTLSANYLASKFKSKPLVYDSHEYFTEVPELQGRKAKKIWERIESWIFPKLKDIITVNQSIADLYQKKYNKELKVVRNIPFRNTKITTLNKEDIGIDENKHVIILQGAGINVDRGAEEAVLAMQYVNNAVLLIVGGGDVLEVLKEMVAENNLAERVRFIPRQSIDKLYGYTAVADVGLSLDKDTNLNYRFSLPNKIFDYIQCGTPVLASDLPEVKNIIQTYDVGIIVEKHNSESIAKSLNYMLDLGFKHLHKNQLNKAAQELIWEQEEIVLKDIYQKYL
ncbi:MAG: glycosyltransferase [Bacteroidales bacterium]|nr:glycosyltransferase [Bacteroidales bacterium]